MADASSKRCRDCGTIGGRGGCGFHRRKASPDGLQARCRECQKERMARWRSDHPNYHKERAQQPSTRAERAEKLATRSDAEKWARVERERLMRLYLDSVDIGPKALETLFEQGGGVCAVCGRGLDPTSNEGDRPCAVRILPSFGWVKDFMWIACRGCGTTIGDTDVLTYARHCLGVAERFRDWVKTVDEGNPAP